MKTIYKYILASDMVSLPVGAKVIHVGIQDDLLFAWAIVNSEEKELTHAIHVVGTGHPMPANIHPYHSTHVVADGALVFHVFINPNNLL